MSDATKEFITYIRENWGKASQCAHCKSDDVELHICSGCNVNAYCGISCQTLNWEAKHQFECIAGKDDLQITLKRPRSDDEDEEEKVVDLATVLQTDVASILFDYLNAVDLKNLKVASSVILRTERTRKAHFSVMIFNLDRFYNQTRGLGWGAKQAINLLQYVNKVATSSISLLQLIISYGDPGTIKKLVIGNNVLGDDRLIAVLSAFRGLIFLGLGHTFNMSLSNLNCQQLQILRVGSSYNQPIIGMQAPKLVVLELGARFNQPIEALDLPNLKQLNLKDSFNQPIILFKAPKLEKLALLHAFNQPFAGFKAPNLKTLGFGIGFTQDLPGDGIPKLEELRVSGNYTGVFSPMYNLKRLFLLRKLQFDITPVIFPQLRYIKVFKQNGHNKEIISHGGSIEIKRQ